MFISFLLTPSSFRQTNQFTLAYGLGLKYGITYSLLLEKLRLKFSENQLTEFLIEFETKPTIKWTLKKKIIAI